MFMPLMKDTRTNMSSLPTQAAPTPIDEEENALSHLPWMIGLTILTLVCVVAGWVIEEVQAWPLTVVWVLYAIAYISGGFYSIQEAWESLQERQFDVNFLMIVAAIGAAVIGQPREGAILMFLFSLSNTLETYAMGRTHASIRALMDMTPKKARLLQTQDDGRNEAMEVPVEQVQVGDRVLVLPGEQIPTDGVIKRGESAVNEASITGESMPVEKQPGMRVFAGTLNGQGALEVHVTTAVQDSVLSRIVKIVSEAREQKATSQRFTDKAIGQYYAYAVVGITLLAFLISLFFMGLTLQEALYRAMTLMVVASPCALVISIPAALLSALASAARGGVLFKGGAHLEAASKIHVVAFDKTGTLTTGQPGVVAIIPIHESMELDNANIVSFTPQQRKEDSARTDDFVGILNDTHMRLLSVAAAIEHYSEHPLARAIERKAQEHDIVLAETNGFEAMTGAGARASIAGRNVRVGRPELFEPLPESVQQTIEEQQQLGHTVVILGDERPWALFAIADTVRPEAVNIVARLKQAGITHTVLLTGDNHYVAEKLARELGVDEVYSELMPEQKVETLARIQETHGPTAMIGDGVNDAPALATATLGIAMGAAGKDVALESANVLLMSDDLSRLPGMVRLARRTRRVVQINLAFAFAVMAVLMVLAMGGSIPLTLAVIGHEGSTLLVVANGLRLLLPWR